MLDILNSSFKINKSLLHLDLSFNDLNEIKGTSIVVSYSLLWLEIQGNKLGNLAVQLIAK